MRLREFERDLRKVCPTVRLVTYNRTFEKGKSFYCAIFVHWGSPKEKQCHLEQFDDIFVATLKFFKELANAPK